jgi:hypothetical protein
MSSDPEVIALSRPRWDGSRVLFEMVDGDRRVFCAISRSALQDLSLRRHFKAADLLQCFASARPRIEAIARSKLQARGGDMSGTLTIWADDIEDTQVAAQPAPAAARPHRG